METIRIKGLEIFAYHGVNPEEKENGQKFILDIAMQADISRANLNEQSAGSGINVGAGSQLALSQQNSRNAAMGKVSSAEADAMSALEAQRQKVKTAYQNAVAQAISENDAARAKALYTDCLLYTSDAADEL